MDMGSGILSLKLALFKYTGEEEGHPRAGQLLGTGQKALLQPVLEHVRRRVGSWHE